MGWTWRDEEAYAGPLDSPEPDHTWRDRVREEELAHDHREPETYLEWLRTLTRT